MGASASATPRIRCAPPCRSSRPGSGGRPKPHGRQTTLPTRHPPCDCLQQATDPDDDAHLPHKSAAVGGYVNAVCNERLVLLGFNFSVAALSFTSSHNLQTSSMSHETLDGVTAFTYPPAVGPLTRKPCPGPGLIRVLVAAACGTSAHGRRAAIRSAVPSVRLEHAGRSSERGTSVSSRFQRGNEARTKPTCTQPHAAVVDSTTHPAPTGRIAHLVREALPWLWQGVALANVFAGTGNVSVDLESGQVGQGGDANANSAGDSGQPEWSNSQRR